MIEIRNYNKENDLEKIRALDNFFALNLEWNGDWHEEDCFVMKDGEKILGVTAMSYDATWYYIDRQVTHIPAYTMKLNICLSKDLDDPDQVETQLVQTAKNHLRDLKKRYPEKKLALRCWFEDDKHEKIQQYLTYDFTMESIIGVLFFDLTGPIPSFPMPENITISQHSFKDQGMQSYLTANVQGFDHVQDSEAEMWFCLGSDKTKVFTAKNKDKVVASTTVWEIGNGRSATENIFTIPDYRHKNIGRNTICYALQYLKSIGEKVASLTCYGTNLPALRLYESLGYRLKYNLIELHYTL